jgi:hypothetical protein
MSLTLGAQPGFTEVADSVFDAGNAASDSSLKALNAAVKFGVVRNEQFWGYYRNGESVALPVSPADGYAYSRGELVYSWSLYWSGSATGACNGTQTAPPKGATTGQGQLLQASGNVDQVSGLVSCTASYFKTSQMDTTDGILLVIAHAQRSR